MGLGDDLKQIAGDVTSQLGGVGKQAVQQAGKAAGSVNPLDILEELLGGKAGPGGGAGGAEQGMKNLEQGGGGMSDQQKMMQQAQLEQLQKQDQAKRQQQIVAQRQRMQASQAQFQQQKAVAEQERKPMIYPEDGMKHLFTLSLLLFAIYGFSSQTKYVGQEASLYDVKEELFLHRQAVIF